MPRFALQIIMACMMGMCSTDHLYNQTPEPPPEHTKCICKPIMKLEWEPTSSLCNNATFDWLLQTVVGQVSKQNEALKSSEAELGDLTQTLTDKDSYIAQLQDQITSLERSLAGVKDEMTGVQDQLEGVKVHRAHLSPRPLDCADVQRYGFHYSGIYTVYPLDYPDGMEVFCDLNTDGGGWLVFQRRQDGSQAFDKLWDEYKHGFGKLAKEFWLGNDMLSSLTEQRSYELRVDLTDYMGQRYYATYDTFVLEDEEAQYKLRVGEYHGDAGDSLNHHRGAPFSTVDRDHDKSRSGNCAELYGGGGWWYVSCYDSNLNGVYSDRHLYETVVWYNLRHNHEPMRHTEMKIRPKNFRE